MPNINVVKPGSTDAYTPYGGCEAFMRSNDHQVILYGGTGTGKSIADDVAVITPNGWMNHGDIKPGDLVFSLDGKPTKVLAVYPQGEIDIYSVKFNDGTSTNCSLDHLWKTKTLYERRKFSGNPNQSCGQPKVRTLEEIKDSISKTHFIDVSQPIEFEPKELEIPPYTLGVLLGDGCLSNKTPEFFTVDDEIADYVQSELGSEYKITKGEYGGRCPRFSISGNGIRQKLRDLNLDGTKSHTKFIPYHYLFGSVEQRTALLQGLMDTDGGVDSRNTGVMQFSTSSNTLALDFRHLVESLGGIVKIKEKIPTYTYKGEKLTGRVAYVIRVSLPNSIKAFRLSRKANLRVERTRYPLTRKIVDVQYIGKKSAQCISVEHDSNLYLLNNFIVTHNTTTCCWKMFLLCLKYPGCKFLFTRTSYTALIKSGVETFERVVREAGMEIGKKSNQIKKIGDSKPTEYQFPYAKREGVDADGNPRTYEGRSRIVLASLDNVKDQLGAEYDFVYLNQPEQATEDDWQYIASRADGRYNHAPYPQIFGDPNPEHSQHWIKKGGYELETGEASTDGRWRLIKSTYRDNPVIWDMKKDAFTPEGEKRIGRALQTYNPIMAKRLIEGEWASYEGLVYAENWDRKRHMISTHRLETEIGGIDHTWKRYWAMDFGFDDPFVCSMWAKHPQKELYIRYKLIYMSNRTVLEHAETIKRHTLGEPMPTLVVADRNPQEIMLLSQALGINIISARKGPGSIKARVNIITDMLKNDELLFLDDALVEDDTRLMQMKKPIGFEQEVENIRWRDNTRLVNDTPKDGDDHEENALGYLFLHLRAENHTVRAVWI